MTTAIEACTHTSSSVLVTIPSKSNTFYDRQLNNWLHKYLYKRVFDPSVGYELRMLYESGEIRNESEFEGRMRDVLSRC